MKRKRGEGREGKRMRRGNNNKKRDDERGGKGMRRMNKMR